MVTRCAISRSRLHHERHGLPPHSIADVAPALRRRLRRLVSADMLLYACALHRFEADLERLQQRAGRRLLCPATNDRLWAELMADLPPAGKAHGFLADLLLNRSRAPVMAVHARAVAARWCAIQAPESGQ